MWLPLLPFPNPESLAALCVLCVLCGQRLLSLSIAQSEIRNPKSEIRNPQSEIRNPKWGVPPRRALTRGPGAV